MKKNTIKCPSCATEIDVQDILANQVESELKAKYDARLSEEKNKLNLELQAFNAAKEDFEAKKRKENEIFREKLEKQLKEERAIIEQKLKAKAIEESADIVKQLQNELNEKSGQLKELNQTKIEIEKLKREKSELKEQAELEAQKKLSETLIAEKEKIKRAEEEKNELKFKELLKQLEDQKKLTEEMKRKQDQGSMQMQGEVLELAIEEFLMNQFPLDTIEEVSKGARGADCLQIVNTRQNSNCGKIYYESKRTKEFQPNWIEKFKADIREKGADIGVLVTEAMPKDMPRMGLKEGIWICNFEEFKGLCMVLRETIIKLNTAVSTQENKGDKMHLLYDYLTGSSFRMQVEAIVEGFTAMKDGLEKEKRAMQRIWTEREKQIEKVITNTISMYGSVRGIAGNAVQTVNALELSDGLNDDEFDN